MENNIIEIENGLISDNHLIQTVNGWVKAKDLEVGDEIINFKGKVTKIEKIIKPGKRPEAPIIGK